MGTSELAIFCNQERLPVEWLGHQPQNFNLQLILVQNVLGQWWRRTCRSSQTMTGSNWDLCHERKSMPDTAWRARNQSPYSQETKDRSKHNWEKKSMNWFLLIACYTCRLEPSIIIIRETTFSYRYPEPNIGQSSGNPAGEGEEGL